MHLFRATGLEPVPPRPEADERIESATFTLEEAQAAVDEAKTLGLRITADGGGMSDTTPTTMTRIAV